MGWLYFRLINLPDSSKTTKMLLSCLFLALVLFSATDAQPSEPTRNTIGGVYSENITLFFMNSPYRVDKDLTVETGATMTIQTGVQLYFDAGVGLKIKGSLYAVGSKFARIQFLPYQAMLNYNYDFPQLRLVDGPNVRQGRLQVLFKDRWRSVCTQQTNWTATDLSVACQSMGYGGGGFWRWFLRNNDTMPFVLPRPHCTGASKTLWDCPGLADDTKIPLSENLCQGEDDLGLYCWGPPSFSGWGRHWKGLQFLNIPFEYVNSDEDQVAVHRQSLSRLEYVDIHYAGYDGTTKNSTAALWIQGVPPFMNGLDVRRSARDGIHIYEATGPILIANSTISYNRGHGIVVENTTDGRVFINETAIENNYGDGVWYRHKGGNQLQLILQSLGFDSRKHKRQTPYYEEERPRVDMCRKHGIPSDAFFPHLIRAFLSNGTLLDPQVLHPCWLKAALPPRLAYTFTLQFISVVNLNPPGIGTKTALIVCDPNEDANGCAVERHRIPIYDGMIPQSLSVRSAGQPIYIALLHNQNEHLADGRVWGDVDVQFRLYATVEDKAFYGLNISNSRIVNNTGSGVYAQDVRDRTALTNVTITHNQGYAGLLVRDGAGDIWINATKLDDNWGDGINVSYVGGSITVNGTSMSRNRMRGAAFHQNTSSHFLSLHQEIIFKGRPSNNNDYLQTIVADNLWGGILVGNFCISSDTPIDHPKVLISYVEFLSNRYHPAFEYHSCQRGKQPVTHVDFTGSRCERGSGMCVRVLPAVNIRMLISSNQFLNNNGTALLIRNRDHPQLKNLPADVTVSKNSFKFNTAQFIVSIGLNEDGVDQTLVFNQQNEIRENRVVNPYPLLKPRSTPYAALIVSSSNVVLRRNCFKNVHADYEIATDLTEHAKWIDARENNWGYQAPEGFMPRIFDQFNRYSLASIDVNPYAAVCNQRNPHISLVQQYFRQFRLPSQPFVLGGAIYENQDLPPGQYLVTEDLHVVPGAKLSIAPGAVLQFEDGVGMLVQGELSRTDFSGSDRPVTFTRKPFEIPESPRIRLVNDEGIYPTTEGRLEVEVDGEWGTICNRSWTVKLAMKACNQLGLAMDPEYLENWRIYPAPGSLPMLMDNIRCEEMEYDITRCRHDGWAQNINVSCPAVGVVGLRCVEPRWAGVRYSLLANPPTVTGQTSMNNWIIEQAGLFDFNVPLFSAALQIDWNYHSFHGLTIRDNFWTGLDVVYNDLTKKPAIRDSRFERNRRHGIRLRSVGLTISDVVISDNEYAGVRYNPIVSLSLQRDIVTWLERREESEMEANNVFIIPKKSLTKVDLYESQLNHRKFLLARPTADCPIAPLEPCVYELTITADGFEYGLASRLGVQIVNRPSNESDENAVFIDVDSGQEHRWDVRRDLIEFPIISKGGKLTMRYTRSYGQPTLAILILFFDSQEYIDRFVHIYKSQITNNQFGVSTLHYSNFSHADGSVLNRWVHEKLWFQKVNFTRNSQAVIWVNAPLQDVHNSSPIAQIEYHIDNCSVSVNNGSIIETHRDLHSSANIFKWTVWSCTFAGNINSGFSIALPDTYDLLAKESHSVSVTENRFINNRDFEFELSGYYSFVNISSNNFTENRARPFAGLIHIRGMEKRLVMERNRFTLNKGHWVVKYDIQSQSIRNNSEIVPAFIQYNYFMRNYLLGTGEESVDRWPRSFCVGVFGCQKVEVHFNRLSNMLLDFELVSGVIGGNITETMNVSYNWWGTGNEAEILQRVFDFDDWNIYTLADYNPYFVTEEQFIDWWWLRQPNKGQLSNVNFVEPSPHDLKGRMYQSITLELVREKWHDFPYYYKPYRPYRISKDLTIMPGATLTIEKGVEVHVWPNVRILVLGNLKAEGTFWEPIRFKPINITEYDEIKGSWNVGRWKRSENPMSDSIYRQFPLLKRQDSFYQKFKVFMVRSGVEKMPERSGFIEIYNATTGEMVPLCDRQFTRRNAEVVCRELGFETNNAYHWVTPRWDYNPLVRILRSYSEPRQCMGTEQQLNDCDLRLNGDVRQWQCVDSEHFVFVHCGPNTAINKDYIGHWGGITFSAPSLEAPTTSGESILRHVEIVGAGYAHNDTLSSAALQMIYRTPVLDHVNVTNSSMNGVQIIAPRSKVLLNFLNITDNRGQGLSILTTNLQSSVAPSGAPFGNITAPYHMFGLVNLCSVGKEIRFENRILIYYKYDSYQVDCVKVFVSENPARKVGFRLMQANFYDPYNPVGRPDSLQFYDGRTFETKKLIADLRVNEPESAQMIKSRTSILGVHLRATAADGSYGFVAEIAALPSAPDTEPVQEITVRHSRFLRNDRGAFGYRSAGEASPNLIVDQCFFVDNGYHIWGNLSTSNMAVELDLHNTQMLRFQSNMLWKNQGGLSITAQSTSSIARLSGLIKDSVFASNEKFATLSLQGRDFQKVYLINNMFTKNRARYYDTVFVDRMTANFTHNYFFNNTGTHTVDLTGYPQVRTESQTFINNFLYENIALGHGHQYPERYGYLPQVERNEQHQRVKRQSEMIAYDDTTFDWWAHIGGDTRRHRTTILAGSAQQHYSHNFFSNPKNDFELTTVNRSVYDVSIGAIDARNNYWGYPGTAGVAAGKIRDWVDYNYLIKVDYLPVLESNTSLIQGDCPAGWFQAGIEEFKSCFLFIGASMPYADAVTFCQEQDAFIPYFMDDDLRQQQVAEKIKKYSEEFISDIERHSGNQPNFETRVWVSGVSIPSTQCGWMSSSSGNIGLQNCQHMLPFICEKGTKPYQEPFLWRGVGLLALLAIIFSLLVLVLLIVLWYFKSKRRSKQHYERKTTLRKSLRASKLERERHENQKHENQRREVQMRRAQKQQKAVPEENRPPSPDLIQQAHRNLVLGRSQDSLSASGLHKTASKDSLSTTVTDDSSATYGKKSGTTKTYSESAYRSDYSPTESYFTGSRSSSRHQATGTPNLYSEIAPPPLNTLNTFTSPAKKPKPVAIPSPVKFRQPINGNGNGNRRDTDLSQMSTTTYCSTCPTTTNTDSVNESRESTITEEGSSWAGTETGTETGSARSTIVDVTTPDEPVPRPFRSATAAASSPNIFTRPKPIFHANSESGLSEDPRDYLQGSLYTPTRDFDRRAAGLAINLPLRTPPRPGRPPPLPPGAGNFPNYAYAESSLSQDSLIKATAAGDPGPVVRPEPPPKPLPSRSLVDLHSPSWHKPNVSSYSLSRSTSEDRPAPLETAM